MKFGLIGKNISYSYSQIIHNKLNSCPYEIIDLEEKELKDFFSKRDFVGINITIPYKEKSIEFLDELSPLANRLKSVNTVINKDGKLIGYNTDYYGLEKTFNKLKIYPKNKSVLVLGSGGVAKTVCAYLKDKGAKDIFVCSRTGEINYLNVYEKCKNANIIINATPVGGITCKTKSLITLKIFNNLSAVIDLVYNPLNTPLILQAKELKIKCDNGLTMLVYQAQKSAELFSNCAIGCSLIKKAYISVLKEKANIIIVGMPSAGKSVVGEKLAKRLNKEFLDTDTLYEKTFGISPAKEIEFSGEAFFRERESEIVNGLKEKSGVIISVGGGTLKNLDNIFALKSNGVFIYLKRKLKNLSTLNRPLSKNTSVKKLYKERKDTFEFWKDLSVKNNKSLDKTVEKIIKKLG